MQDKPVNMGLKLFPPTPKERTAGTPSRKRSTSTRRHAVIPQSAPQSAVERAESPDFEGRQSAMDGRQSALDGRQSALDGRQSALDGRQSAMDGRQSALGGRETPSGRQTPQYERQNQNGRSTPQEWNGRQTPQYNHPQPQDRTPPRHHDISPITTPPHAHLAAEIPRSHTSFSEAPTLVRSTSNSSHTSTKASPQRGGEPVMRSIFPRYNPEIALEHQAYFPTQTSPTHIPRTVINRAPYSPSISERSAAGLQSPMVNGSSPGRFPRGVQDESILEPSTNEELKELWKVVNGWRVSASEGRTFCLKMNSAAEEPIHTLSSATQPFYSLKLIPTSTSAQMTMQRYDPNKTKSGSPRLGSSKAPVAMEVMSTTLEESVRRLPPNDGLVALLYPRAASDMVIELANKVPARADAEQVVAAAERECGRLVWDEDSGKYYLVHPAISTPFIVSIASSPAWSRVEYTLEHPELPRNIVKLTRDGAGSGYLEVDTAVSARIDCFYVVDVAICAIMLVALAEEKTRNIEHFDAPPSIAPRSPKTPERTSTWSKLPKGKKQKKSKDKDVKFEEFELDLESQESVKGKEKKEEKIPGFFGLIWMLIKCFVWTITMFFKALAKIIIFISKCLTRRKK